MSFTKLPHAVVGAAFSAGATFSILPLALRWSDAMQVLAANGAPHPAVAALLMTGVEILVVGLFSVPVVALFGLTAHTMLIRFTPARAWIYVMAGFVIAALCGGLIWLGLTPPLAPARGIELVYISGVSGAMAALTFWLIRRPDRDAPSQPSK